jgi:hypothetical protein
MSSCPAARCGPEYGRRWLRRASAHLLLGALALAVWACGDLFIRFGTGLTCRTRIERQRGWATIAEPADGTTVSGTVLVRVQATESCGGLHVWIRFRSDGEGSVEHPIGEASTVPVQLAWNTTGLPDGRYQLLVSAEEAAIASIRVTVANGPR